MTIFQPMDKTPFFMPKARPEQVFQKSPLLLLVAADERFQLAHAVKDEHGLVSWLDSDGEELDTSSFLAWSPILVPPVSKLINLGSGAKNQPENPTFDSKDLKDEDGYPTEYALWLISSYPSDELEKLFELIESLWAFKSFGFHRKGNKLSLSTAGWSGNEAIIEALTRNELAWHFSWKSSRVGGHYEFEIKAV